MFSSRFLVTASWMSLCPLANLSPPGPWTWKHCAWLDPCHARIFTQTLRHCASCFPYFTKEEFDLKVTHCPSKDLNSVPTKSTGYSFLLGQAAPLLLLNVIRALRGSPISFRVLPPFLLQAGKRSCDVGSRPRCSTAGLWEFPLVMSSAILGACS